MKLRNIFYPSGDKKEIKEIVSYTLTWHTKSNYYNSYNEHNKVFTSKEDAKLYEEQLKEANTFLKTGFSINSSITEN